MGNCARRQHGREEMSGEDSRGVGLFVPQNMPRTTRKVGSLCDSGLLTAALCPGICSLLNCNRGLVNFELLASEMISSGRVANFPVVLGKSFGFIGFLLPDAGLRGNNVLPGKKCKGGIALFQELPLGC